jgi:hypothetical protein
MNYDPVCFDTRVNSGSREFPIVQLDHECILCNDIIDIITELARNFKQLAVTIIADATKGSQR